MRIAIVGTRGIPNRYGGFERFAEQVSSRFADHGHEVTVYCRRAFTDPDDVYDRRVKRVIVPSLHQKHLDTLVSTFLAAVHAAFARYDVVLICNVANAPFCYLPRMLGTPVVLNVDGLDRKRSKWNWLGARVLHFCEWMSSFSPSRLVTDANTIHDYYFDKYGADSTVIGYGSEMPLTDYSLNGFKLEPGRYVLYVSRLEPENNPELVLRSWKNVRSDWPLVMVGDNAYKPEYLEGLRKLADDRVIFTGAIYGPGYWALQKYAAIFVFACEIGGVHPALVESMAAQNAVLYLDTPENSETAGDAAIRYVKDEQDLSQKLQLLLDDEEARYEWAARAQKRAREFFAWENIARKYESVFEALVTPAGEP
ncbi:MAG: glycosyltransferase [Candidatus Eremiobacteraeota bacterium]|nr:glycosyltransferase [Candidatus Eremiobacteraeota bacterium]